MRKLKAQQITEFMLAAPLLILFFTVLTEFAFAFNSNLVFTNSIKSSVSAYISTINVESRHEDFENAIRNYVQTDMENNRIPNLESLNVELIAVDSYPAVVGTYTYNPEFTFTFLPALRRINMNTTTVFPFNVQDNSGYEDGISTDELDLIQPPAVLEEEIEAGGGV